MINSTRLRMGQPVVATHQASCKAASSLAQIARDQFWAALRDGDRPAMIYWSARENVLRRRAYGRMAIGALPARISGQA